MTTNQLTQEMLKMLELLGCYAWRQNIRVKGGKYPCTSKDGISDICAISPRGLFIAVEVKRKKEKQRETQIKFMQEVLQRDARYFICRSMDDIAAIIKLLAEPITQASSSARSLSIRPKPSSRQG